MKSVVVSLMLSIVRLPEDVFRVCIFSRVSARRGEVRVAKEGTFVFYALITFSLF